jgi:hypothetical protein
MPNSLTPPAASAAARPSRGLLGWSVANFKAFGREPQSIPLAPITLVFGPNSAGKSSALHSLLFAHEAVTSGELDIHEPRLAEGAIDLGGFSQFTFCQRTDEHPVSLEYTLSPVALNKLFERTLGQESSVQAATLTLGLVLAIVSDAAADSAAGQPALIRLDLMVDGRPFCQVGRDRDGALTFRTLDLEHPFFAGVRRSYAELLRPDTARPALADERVLELCNNVFPRTVLCFDGQGLLPDSALLGPPGEYGVELPPEPLTDPDGLTDAEHLADFEAEEAEEQELRSPLFSPGDPDYEAIGVLMPRFAHLLGEVIDSAGESLRESFAGLTYLGPLRSFPDRDFTLTHNRDAHWHSGGGFAWDVLARDDTVRAKVNAWFASDFLKTPYQFVVTGLVSEEIVSSAIESELADIVHEKSDEHDMKRASRDDHDLEGFAFPYDAWDSDELGKRISSKALDRAKASRRTELRLIDKRTGARVSHRDVGVGLSQILPILVRAFSEREKLHLIEQPEIHVHPALQAELGDVFIQSALGEAQNRFLIETHSEHLILRILRRVRQTTAEDTDYLKNGPRVTPEDVAVIYAEPTKNGTKLHRLRVSPDGDFADRWPHGFFTERGVELFT